MVTERTPAGLGPHGRVRPRSRALTWAAVTLLIVVLLCRFEGRVEQLADQESEALLRGGMLASPPLRAPETRADQLTSSAAASGAHLQRESRASRVISGRVRTDAGAAIPGAKLRLRQALGSGDAEAQELARATATEDGSFRLALDTPSWLDSHSLEADPESGLLSLAASAEHFLPCEILLCSEATGPFELVLPSAAEASLMVIAEADGSPIPGAEVLLRVAAVTETQAQSERPHLRCRSDERGLARCTVPAAGPLSAIVRAEGFLTGFAELRRAEEGHAYTGEVRLGLALELGGRVLAASDEAPLENVSIQDREGRELARSRADGSYRLRCDSASFARLRYELDGYAPAEIAARGEHLQRGALPDVTLQRGARIDGTWLSGALERVEARADRRHEMGIRRGTWTLPARVAAPEGFTIERVPPQQPSELWFHSREHLPIAVLLQGSESGEEVHLKPLSLEGLHAVEIELTGLEPGEGARVGWTLVPRLLDADPRVLEPLESTGSLLWPAGTKRLRRDGVPSGVVRLEAISASGRRAQAKLALRGKGSSSACVLAFEASQQICGRIAAEDGSAVGEIGLRVSRTKGDFYAVGRCRPDGSFALEVLPEGEHALELFAVEGSRRDLGIGSVGRTVVSAGAELHLVLPVLDGTLSGVLRCPPEHRPLLRWTSILATDTRSRRFEARVSEEGAFELLLPRRESFTVCTAIAIPPTHAAEVDPRSWPAMVSREGVHASSDPLQLEWSNAPR